MSSPWRAANVRAHGFRFRDFGFLSSFVIIQCDLQLEGTENRITVERQKFNEEVQRYNTSVKSFPTVFLAGMFRFQPKPYLKPLDDPYPEFSFRCFCSFSC